MTMMDAFIAAQGSIEPEPSGLACAVCGSKPERLCPTYYTTAKGSFPQAVLFCDACRIAWAAGYDVVTLKTWKAKLAELGASSPVRTAAPTCAPQAHLAGPAPDITETPRKRITAPRKAHGPEKWKARRERLSMSRQELGQKAGVSPRTVESWEQGVRQPAKAAALAIEQVLWPSRSHLGVVERSVVDPDRLDGARLTARGTYRLPTAG